MALSVDRIVTTQSQQGRMPFGEIDVHFDDGSVLTVWVDTKGVTTNIKLAESTRFSVKDFQTFDKFFLPEPKKERTPKPKFRKRFERRKSAYFTKCTMRAVQRRTERTNVSV